MSGYQLGTFAKLADEFAARRDADGRLSTLEHYAGRLDVDAEYDLRDVVAEIGRQFDVEGSKLPRTRVVRGAAVVGDLRRLVEELSEAAGLTVDTLDEPFLTVEQAGEHFDVPADVIDRWRDRGLISRRVRVGADTRIGFTVSSVSNFERNHGDEIDRVHGKNSRRASEGGGASSAPTDGPPAAADTHGKGRPKSLARGPITDAERREIVRHHRRGMDVTRIARRSGRSRSTIYRVLSANRLERLVEVDLSYIDSDEFRRDDADAVILDAAAPESTGRLSRPPSGLPAYLASLYTVPLLNRAQEQYWFRRMNYLKFKATDLRDKLQARKRRGEKALAEAERLVREVDDVKNFLIRSNLRLVVSLAKKKVATGRDFFEMVSDGNVSLIRAVEKFDYSKGNKFSTYATWAIVKNYARSIPAEHKQLDRFRTGNEEVFDASGADAAVPIRAELENAAQKRVLRKYLSRLEDRERSIMVARFGLEPGTEPLTLEEVGRELGVTKERVRQLQGRALKKLRGIAETEPVDIPGL